MFEQKLTSLDQMLQNWENFESQNLIQNHQNLFKYWFVLCQFAMKDPVRPFETAHVRVLQRSLFLTSKLGTTNVQIPNKH